MLLKVIIHVIEVIMKVIDISVITIFDNNHSIIIPITVIYFKITFLKKIVIHV